MNKEISVAVRHQSTLTQTFNKVLHPEETYNICKPLWSVKEAGDGEWRLGIYLTNWASLTWPKCTSARFSHTTSHLWVFSTIEWVFKRTAGEWCKPIHALWLVIDISFGIGVSVVFGYWWFCISARARLCAHMIMNCLGRHWVDPRGHLDVELRM